MTTKTIEREKYLVDLLKKTGPEGVSGHTIDTNLGITPKNRSLIVNRLIKSHPQIRNISTSQSAGAVYAWIEDTITDAPKDLTLEPTLEVKPQPKPAHGIPHPGECWKALESNGSYGMIFVLNSLNGAAQCIKLYPKNEKQLTIASDDSFEIKVQGIDYVGDATRPMAKPLKYLKRMTRIADSIKLDQVKDLLKEVFNIKTPVQIPEVIEKEVIKEVPVEDGETIKELEAEIENLKSERLRDKNEIARLKIRLHRNAAPEIPDGYVDCMSAEIAILKEQRDIWKSVAEALLGK